MPPLYPSLTELYQISSAAVRLLRPCFFMALNSFGLVHVVSPPFNIFIIQDFLYIVKGFL